jgi:hypothetical protein
MIGAAEIDPKADSRSAVLFPAAAGREFNQAYPFKTA